ncbi:CD276 antigen [Clupea harengus]|uniref:CD276 antigen n=1 Tax=Clupea harengus TaxID=7950 RepID=A0A6P3W6K3_CLUHA|nr:CD276 antigen [Clupea harengus]
MLLSLLLSSLLAVQTMAKLELVIPELPVVALFGRDAVLNCSFWGEQASGNLSELSVFWQLTDTKRSVHAFTAGADQLADQSPAFLNRTSLFGRGALSEGNASLLLRRVRVDDEGSYTCFVRVQNYASAAMLLQVAAPYTKPMVTLTPNSNLRPGDKVELTCMAYGGYPEAEVVWQDGAGHNLTDNLTVSQVATELGLFSVRSVLTVMLEPDSTYHCRLTNALLGDDGHASVTITGQNMAFPPVVLGVTVGLAVCLLVLLIALAAVCRKKIKESCEEIRLEEEARELEEEAKAGLRDGKQGAQAEEGQTPVLELSDRVGLTETQ